MRTAKFLNVSFVSAALLTNACSSSSSQTSTTYFITNGNGKETVAKALFSPGAARPHKFIFAVKGMSIGSYFDGQRIDVDYAELLKEAEQAKAQPHCRVTYDFTGQDSGAEYNTVNVMVGPERVIFANDAVTGSKTIRARNLTKECN